MNPKVSVISSCFNKVQFISETLDSVFGQKTSYDFEVVVVDDCSTDGSINLLRHYASDNQNLTLIESKENVGAAEARNIGIEHAQGQYIAFIDMDDIWYKTKLQDQVDFMVQDSCAISGTWYHTINEEGKLIGQYCPKDLAVGYRDLLSESKFGTSTVMYDTAILGKQYFPNIKKRQDFALWLRITGKNNVKVNIIHKPLVSYRVGVTGAVSKSVVDCVKYRYKVLREIEGFSTASCIYWTICYLYRVIIKRINYRRLQVSKGENAQGAS